MKKISLILFLALLSVSNTRAQKPFEGNITVAGTANDKSAGGVAHVKGNHIEMDLGSTLMGDAKIFIDTRLQKITRVFGSHEMQNEYDSDTSNVVLTPTGNHKTIAGFDAQEYSIASGKIFKTKLWAAPGLQSDLAEAVKSVLLSQAPPAALRAGNLLLSRGLTVLRAELAFTVMGRDITSSGEYVKAEPQSIDDAVFKIPSDLSMVPLTESMMPQDE